MSALTEKQWAIDEEILRAAVERGAGSLERLQRIRAAVDDGYQILSLQNGRTIRVVEIDDAIRCAR